MVFRTGMVMLDGIGDDYSTSNNIAYSCTDNSNFVANFDYDSYTHDDCVSPEEGISKDFLATLPDANKEVFDNRLVAFENALRNAPEGKGPSVDEINAISAQIKSDYAQANKPVVAPAILPSGAAGNAGKTVGSLQSPSVQAPATKVAPPPAKIKSEVDELITRTSPKDGFEGVVKKAETDPKLQGEIVEAIKKDTKAQIDVAKSDLKIEEDALKTKKEELVTAESERDKAQKAIADQEKVISDQKGIIKNETDRVVKATEAQVKSAGDVKGDEHFKKAIAGDKVDGGKYVSNGLTEISKIDNESKREKAMREFLADARDKKISSRDIQDAVDTSWAKGVTISDKGVTTGLSNGLRPKSEENPQGKANTVISNAEGEIKKITDEQTYKENKAIVNNQERNIENLKSEQAICEARIAELKEGVIPFLESQKAQADRAFKDGKIDQAAYKALLGQYRSEGISYGTTANNRLYIAGSNPISRTPKADAQTAARLRQQAEDAAIGAEADYRIVNGQKMVLPDNDKYPADGKALDAEAVRVRGELMSKHKGFTRDTSKELEQYLNNASLSPAQRDRFLKTMFDDNTTFSKNFADTIYKDKSQQAEVSRFLTRQGYKLDGVDGGMLSRERVNFHKVSGIGANTPAFGAMAAVGTQQSGGNQKTSPWGQVAIDSTKSFVDMLGKLVMIGATPRQQRSSYTPGMYSSMYRPISPRTDYLTDRVGYKASAQGRAEFTGWSANV